MAESDFPKYAAMRDQGCSATEVFRAAKAEGLSAIEQIRLLRSVFGLSLDDAKRISSGGCAWLLEPQKLEVGRPVYWEGWDSIDGSYLMKGVVRQVTPSEVVVNDQEKFHYRDGEFHAIPTARYSQPISRRYFEKPLIEQILENAEALQRFPEQFRQAV